MHRVSSKTVRAISAENSPRTRRELAEKRFNYWLTLSQINHKILLVIINISYITLIALQIIIARIGSWDSGLNFSFKINILVSINNVTTKLRNIYSIFAISVILWGRYCKEHNRNVVIPHKIRGILANQKLENTSASLKIY